MSDFLLDLRAPGFRTAAVHADRLRFLPHVQVVIISKESFDLAITVTEDSSLWGPFSNPDGSRVVALAGRVALDDADWERGVAVEGAGGVACKAIDRMIQRSGLEAVENLSGNFVLIVWERATNTLHLLTDASGVLPAFETQDAGTPVFGSHPDILADASGQSSDFDEISISEFLLTGTVSPPFTHYRRIQAIGRAMALEISANPATLGSIKRRCYFPLQFNGNPSDRQEDLASEFASAFKSTIQARSRGKYGRCAVALSGGLDSRVVLACLDPSADAFAFTCFDAENLEYAAASSIASAARVPFQPFRRPFEYYGDHAEAGVSIGAGMGSFANNHFLGVIPWLREQGARTLLTGCYCDYLFKALPLNLKSHPVTGLEELAPFKEEFYFHHTWPNTQRARQVQERIRARYPSRLTQDTSDSSVFDLEVVRTFPLCYEGDNSQRVIPQRVTGWFLPVSDPRLLRVYCRIPYRWKLNRSIFKQAVRILCGSRFDSIPDANTGARVGAPWWAVAAKAATQRVLRQYRKLRPSIATQGSWPNWRYYTKHSRVLADLWERPVPDAEPLLRTALGSAYPESPFGAGSEAQMWLQVQMLTVRLWMSRRR
jgi:asparagine synthase (glutamine-hydrolysing)